MVPNAPVSVGNATFGNDLPLTLIASIWGMTVHVPGEGDMTAFYVVLAFMVVILGGMIAYFRKRGFL